MMSDWEYQDRRLLGTMDCSEFLGRFSEFYDAPLGAPIRRDAETHMEECEKCARYEQVVSRGVKLLQGAPRMELPESFRPRLQHRLFHIDDWDGAAHTTSASAVPVAAAVGMAILLTIIAWYPSVWRATPEVSLPAIIVSGPPGPAPLFPTDVLGFPVGSPLNLGSGLWSDPNTLLYEYSPMGERYRNNSVLRRTGLD